MPRRRTGKLTTQQRAARRWDRMCFQNLKLLDDVRDNLLVIQTRFYKMQKLASEFNLQVDMTRLKALAQETNTIFQEISPIPELVEQSELLSLYPSPSVACTEFFSSSPIITTSDVAAIPQHHQSDFMDSAPVSSCTPMLPMEVVTTPLSFSAIARIDSTEPELLPPSSPTLSCSSIDTQGESITDDNVSIYEISSVHSYADDHNELIHLHDEDVSPPKFSLVVSDIQAQQPVNLPESAADQEVILVPEVVPSLTVNVNSPMPQPKQSSEFIAKAPMVLKVLTIPKPIPTVQLSTTASSAPASPKVIAMPTTTPGEEQAQERVSDAEERTSTPQDVEAEVVARDTPVINAVVDGRRCSEQDAKKSLSWIVSKWRSILGSS